MHTEEVLKSQFNMGITCSQIMHAEQALKSQFNTESPAAKSCMLNKLKNFSLI